MTITTNNISYATSLGLLPNHKSQTLDLYQNFLEDSLTAILKQTAAKKGALLLSSPKGHLEIKTVVDTEKGPLLLQGNEQEMEKLLPLSILEAVHQSKQAIFSTASSPDDKPLMDDYLQSRRPSSYCCLPILSKSETLGVLYLENWPIEQFASAQERDLLQAFCQQLGLSLQFALSNQKQQGPLALSRENKDLKPLIEAGLLALDQERKSIGTELHDNIGALLSATKLYMGHLADINKEPENNALHQKIEELINQSISTVREMSQELAAVSLERFGLATAIKALCKESSIEKGIQVHFRTSLKTRFTEVAERHLFYLIKDLLQQALDFEQARHIHIDLEIKGQSLELSFQDEAEHFDLAALKQEEGDEKEVRINKILARTECLQGKIQYFSDDKIGTKVIICMEYNKLF